MGVSSLYEQFCTNEPAGVNLKVDLDEMPSLQSASPVLTTSGPWNLYTEDGRWIISINGPPGTGLLLIAKFDTDYHRGEITFNKNIPRRTPFYPLVYPLDELLIINLLSQGLGVELHASAIALDKQDRGLLFTGMSGAGKSTLTRLWQDRTDDVTILSDDRVIIRKKADGYWIYGTPWHGDGLGASPKAVPLDRIFILNQALDNKLSPLGPLEMITKLFVRSFPTYWNADGMAFTLKFLEELSHSVQCYEFSFLPDQSAIDYILRELKY